MNKTPVAKRVDALTVEDLAADPVWRYSPAQTDDLLVRPVKRLPVKSLVGKIVGTPVRLANDSEVWAILGNIDTTNMRLTAHFLTVSVERDGKWFHLARYHDPDFRSRGPLQLARFLRLRPEEVFPISYDVRRYVARKPRALAGTIPLEPPERLSREEVIALAVP